MQHLYLQTVRCLLRCLGGLASGLERYPSAVHVSWESAQVRYVYVRTISLAQVWRMGTAHFNL